MTFNFKWSAYGDLNPVSQKKFGARYDSQVSSFEDAQKELLNKHYTSDAISKRTDWVGVVLRVDGKSYEPNNFLDASQDEPRRTTQIRVKVRVPELHAHIPEPMSPDDHFVIDMHPTYTGLHNRLPVPKPGDRILVSHLGAENLSDPVYKQYLEDDAGKISLGSKARRARNCLEYAPGLGCLEKKPGSDGRINVKLFPAPRGSLKAKTSNSTAFLFGDSQMAGNFGKVFEAYLKHHGWSVKRNGRSGSAVKHWRKQGKVAKIKPSPPGYQLKGFLDEALSTNPELAIISLGGNTNYGSDNAPGTPGHAAWKKAFIARTKDLAKQCLKSSKTVMWFGAPPTVKNTSKGYPPRHDWNTPGIYKYREVVNLAIEEALKTFEEYDKTLFFINPIGSSTDGYAGKEKYLKNYEGPGGDGIHLTVAAATEYIKVVAGEKKGQDLTTSTKSAAPGIPTPKSPQQSVDPYIALIQAKKERAIAEAEGDADRVKELDKEIKKYEKMPKAITTEQREKFINQLNKLGNEINIKNQQLIQATQSGDNQAILQLSEEIDVLEAEIKAIEELLTEDDKATKPSPCDPCTPGDKNIKNKWETEPLALNWEEAKKDGNTNATKYIRAFLRMIIIGEGGRKSWGNVSPYNLCVGGSFVTQRAQNGLPAYKNANEATRLGPKTRAGNSFVGYEGHPRLLFNWRKGVACPAGCSTAAGRYQFMENTWYKDWGPKFGSRDVNDFTPINQDRVVADYLTSKGIKEILEEGGDNFVTPTYDGSRDINKGKDDRPSSVKTIVYKDTRKNHANYGKEISRVTPQNKFEEQFYLAVDKVRLIWASLPGSPYEGQHTSKKETVFLDYYKFALAQEIEAEEAGKDTGNEPVEA